jgi:CspA family cold shock protein
MATGRVLQFDRDRGYGFIAADDGGEDVFLHASVFGGDSADLAPGVTIEFQVMAGDRGRKAFAAHVLPGEPDPESVPVRPSLPARSAPAVLDEQMCDVLSPAEFSQELTELLLSNVHALTGQQILEVRHNVLEYAVKHGWVDS